MSSDSPQIMAIRSRYKASFNEKKQLVDEYIERLSDKPTDKLILSELHGELHKLAGSSGMYGYDDISCLCRRIMQEIVNDCFHEIALNLEGLSQLFGVYIKED